MSIKAIRDEESFIGMFFLFIYNPIRARVVELVDAKDSKEYGREDKPPAEVPMISQFPKMGIGEKSQKMAFSLEMFSQDLQKQAPKPRKKGRKSGGAKNVHENVGTRAW